MPFGFLQILRGVLQLRKFRVVLSSSIACAGVLLRMPPLACSFTAVVASSAPVINIFVGHHRDHELPAVEPERLRPVVAGGVHGGEVQHLLPLRALLFKLAFLVLGYDGLAVAVGDR